MDPEESLMPLLSVSLAHNTSSILVHELANHCLRDGVDNIGICRLETLARRRGRRLGHRHILVRVARSGRY